MKKNKPLVIGLVGPRGSGKTTLARSAATQLSHHNVTVNLISMSAPLVAPTRSVLTSLGYHGEWEHGNPDSAEVKALMVGTKTFRQHLIDMSDSLKSLFGDNYFVECAKVRLAHVNQSHVALIHNIRYPQEAELCDVLIRIDRAGTENTDTHSSERLQDDLPTHARVSNVEDKWSDSGGVLSAHILKALATQRIENG